MIFIGLVIIFIEPVMIFHNFNDIHNRWVCTSTLHSYSRFAPDYLTMKCTMHRMHACSKKIVILTKLTVHT